MNNLPTFTAPPYRLSERDTFAIEILAKLLALPEYKNATTDTAANDAYAYTQEMLLAREQQDRANREL